MVQYGVVLCGVAYRVAPQRIEGRLHHNRSADLAIPNTIQMELKRLRERIEEDKARGRRNDKGRNYDNQKRQYSEVE